jgi:hypothetical protein
MIVVLRESVARSFLCRLNQIRPLRHGRDLHARVQHMSMLFAVTLIPDEDRRRRCPFGTATGASTHRRDAHALPTGRGRQCRGRRDARCGREGAVGLGPRRALAFALIGGATESAVNPCLSTIARHLNSQTIRPVERLIGPAYAPAQSLKRHARGRGVSRQSRCQPTRRRSGPARTPGA